MKSQNFKLILCGILILMIGVFIGNYYRVPTSGPIPADQKKSIPTRNSGVTFTVTKAELDAVTEAIKNFQANITTLPAPPSVSRELVLRFIGNEKDSEEAYATAAFYLEDPGLLREGLKRYPENENLMTLLLLMDYKNMTADEIGKFKKLNPASSLPNLMGAVISLQERDADSALQSLLTVDASKINLQCLSAISNGEKKLYNQFGGLNEKDSPFAMRASSHVDIAEKLIGSLGTLEKAVKKLRTEDPAKASMVLANLASTALSLTQQPLNLAESHTALRLESWAYRNMDPNDESLKNRFSEDLATLKQQNDSELKQLNVLRSLKSQIHLGGKVEDIEKYKNLLSEKGDLSALQTLIGEPDFFQYLVPSKTP